MSLPDPTELEAALARSAITPSPPIPPIPRPPTNHPTLLRSLSESESSAVIDPQPSARPPKLAAFPDPSQYPDPYPFRPPHHHLTSITPALSSGGSSTASTRSSAYTSSSSAFATSDYGHEVHVATGDEDAVGVGVGITSDVVVQLLDRDRASMSSAGSQSRAPIDQARWSEGYLAGRRSRPPSYGHTNPNSLHENGLPNLHHKLSFETGWHPVDERDEAGLSTDEEETDEDFVGQEVVDIGQDERTAAIVIVEEGRGLIVRGDDIPLVQLQVQPGTTHLLLGSSPTPNVMPSFLANVVPDISHSLLALDISANFLHALPPCLAACTYLEELNIASNPLRVIPVFLSQLTSLRVLIADATGVATLPETLRTLDKLHTLSVRRNKMNSLPSWLCLLPSLQTLLIDSNPFQGPWKALVTPLLAESPILSSIPAHPYIVDGSPGHANNTDLELTDAEDLDDSLSSDRKSNFQQSPDEITVTLEQGIPFDPSGQSSTPSSEPSPPDPGLVRTRTTPNRAFHLREKDRSSAAARTAASNRMTSPKAIEAPAYFGDLQVRKMKSAGDLKTHALNAAKPALPRNTASSSDVLDDPGVYERPAQAKRFGTLGIMPPDRKPPPSASRPSTAPTWEDPRAAPQDPSAGPSRLSLVHQIPSQPVGADSRPPKSAPAYPGQTQSQSNTSRSRTRDGKEKSGKWGFLKKMSMGKMRPDSTSPRTSPPRGRLTVSKPIATPAAPISPPTPPVGISTSPQIDLRFSTTGILDSFTYRDRSSPSPHDKKVEKKPSRDVLKLSAAPAPSSSNLLSPVSPTPVPTKRRSFLPIDPSPSPDATAPSAGVTVSSETPDADDTSTAAPSPGVDSQSVLQEESNKLHEGYSRALRSVMAYLKDMNDLALSHTSPPVSMHSSFSDEHAGPTLRSRRTTGGEATSELSVTMSGTSSSSGMSGRLRPSDPLRGRSQTFSVVTSSSNDSAAEERKFKDDKSKRVMVLREIIETERTYVKGLQELVDIYIKPASATLSSITGASSRDTVVPAAERKIVFGSVDSLFSFHKENLLPALEAAAAPLMTSAAALQANDADGQLSLRVAKAVGSMFVKHAAFMKMYSSYINNFDNSVQRVKLWSCDRPTTSSSPGLTPSSSTTQLVGLGLALSGIAGNVAESNGATVLTSGQRKRIKSYLKRCRMNPRHSQLNLEGYLLLPVQRIPRYRLLLEELLSSTPPMYDQYSDDPLERAFSEISLLANNMNEGKRESESRRKLVQWQARIRGRFPSPLVQPHRRLIMDGPLLLTRVVRKAMVAFEAINAQGDSSTVQVDCLAPELTPRPLIGILCNDLLVLCRDPSDGQDPTSPVDLWAVLRMQTLPQPASIVHGNALRLVDNKAILYFDAPSPSDALNWFRAINLHIPASKS